MIDLLLKLPKEMIKPYELIFVEISQAKTINNVNFQQLVNSLQQK